MNQQLFDYESAVARFGGDQDVFRELAERYVHYCPERVSRLRDAASRGDLEQAGATANLLRGVLAVLSADEAHAAARELSICCARQDRRAMRSASEVLIDSMKRLDEELRRTLRAAA
jgi:HPt (histidine-containing phosphotransfer) domain-containing protein